MSSISGLGTNSTAWHGNKPDVGKMAEKLFKQLDKDGNAGIGEAELGTAGNQAGAPESDATALLKGLDSDGDKSISKQELSSGMQTLADQFAANFNAARTKMAGESDTEVAQSPVQSVGSAQLGEAQETESGGEPTAIAVQPANAGATAASAEQTSYDKADANEDGTVTEMERLAYEAEQAAKVAQQATRSPEDVNSSGAEERLGQAYGIATEQQPAGSFVSELA